MSFILSLGTPLLAADPPYYVKRATWHETLLAATQALAEQPLEDTVEPFESDVRRGGQTAQHVSVKVSGAERLFLHVTGDPDKIWGVANWADAKLIDQQGQAHFLTTASIDGPGKPALDWKVLKGQHDLNITLHSGLYEPLRIAGRRFARGLHVLADSEILVALDGQYDRFEAWVGVDDWAGTNGRVRFRVLGARAAAAQQLWDLLARDFPEAAPRRQMRWEQLDRVWSPRGRLADEKTLAQRYAEAATRYVPALAARAREATNASSPGEALTQARAAYLQARHWDAAAQQAREFDFAAVRLAMQDLTQQFGRKYPQGADYLARLDALERQVSQALANTQRNDAALAGWPEVAALAEQLEALRREALLANPLLDFDRLLVLKRRPLGDPRRSQWADRGLGEYIGLPRQSSWGYGTMTAIDNWENEIAVLSPVRPEGTLTPLVTPPERRLIGDVDLHFDAGKLLFAMPDAQQRWQVHEFQIEARQLRQLTPSDHPDVHNYDACYLPNGRIAFISTAPLQGVPCNAGVIVGMMYLMEADGSNIRQIAFEQDHNYTPSVMNDGRILYLRWDYTDTPHVWNRILMSMNPDGTGQAEVYGSGSYWPNAVFFARSIPNHPSKLIGIVTGHHEGRVGELILFDPAQGRHEVSGVVQRIPGRGLPVEPKIEDKLTEHSWPKFLHPWPLHDKYFIVACKPTPDSLWGIYLADVFDNLVLLREEEHFALLEPIPLRPTPAPPVIEDKVRPHQGDALVYLEDVYQGPGLKDVPRGTVKNLRLFTYHFGYQKMAGIDHRVGTDGPWEVKRVLGTVPVEPDGSALFRVPAKTPVSLQPLDAEGQALALMRSWLTAMPGETLSCIGCHDRMGNAPLNRRTQALQTPARDPQPWHGPVRGFSFAREVQPVLDRFCVGCHDGQPRADGQTPPDLRGDTGTWVVYEHGNPELKPVRAASRQALVGKYAGVFEPAYIALRQLVRVGKLESDLHVLPPMEFHANTSELIQMLRKGHHHVKLDAEAWDRLITWIDLNAPCHGTWGEVSRIPIAQQPERRRELRRLYGGVAEDAEKNIGRQAEPAEPLPPPPVPPPPVTVLRWDGWPLSTADAQRLQKDAAGDKTTRTVDLGDGVGMEFVRIPAGRFVMGDRHGESDEQPASVVEIKRPFWMARFEVSNEQYRRFDRSHDSRFEHRTSWMFSEPYLGWPLNQPRQPVVRVSWNQAMAFSRWLSETLGERVTLPTEAQWEYACRAGSAAPLSYGDLDTDFATHANLADQNLRRLAYEGWRPKAPDNVARDDRFDDGALVTARVGSYQPNAWGLHDLHGNAAEWTRSSYRPYPYQAAATDDLAPSAEDKVVRGGSWRDRPQRGRSSFRLSYPAYQRVFNVGFRVIIEDDRPALQAAR